MSRGSYAFGLEAGGHGERELSVTRFVGTEALSEPYLLEVDFSPPRTLPLQRARPREASPQRTLSPERIPPSQTTPPSWNGQLDRERNDARGSEEPGPQADPHGHPAARSGGG